MKMCSKCSHVIDVDAYVVLGERFVHLRCFSEGLRAELRDVERRLADALGNSK
jgi:hypothetical protein